MSNKRHPAGPLLRLDRRVWLPAVFGLPIVTIFAVSLNFRLFSNTHSHRGTQSTHSGRVTIWNPPPCHGSFVSEPAPLSKEGVPYAIIRDAVVDRRPVSHSHYREIYHGNAFQRLILYLSVHLSVHLTRDNAKVSLLSPDNTSVPGTLIRMNYVQIVDPFLLVGPYKPGRVTRRGNQVSEWQVVLSLAPEDTMSQADFDTRIQQLSEEGSTIHLELVFKHFDHKKSVFKSSFDLSCVTGWERSEVFPTLKKLQQPTCHTDVHSTTGAVVVSGSALYGAKKREARHYVEVAHFGARALGGPVRFDVAAMGVVVNNSASDRQLCKNESCIVEMNRKNEHMLETIREVVEAELLAVGLHRSLWQNLILVPLCRLGSDASNTELDDPCKLCHRYGQYHATFFSYAMLAPYFKWAASYDLDEFFSVSAADSKLHIGRADDVLDEVNRYGKGYMYFTWLDFEVSSNSSRVLTKRLLSASEPTLRHKEANEDFDCHRFSKDPTGKSAMRCDVGVGFTIHRPVIRKLGEPLGILGQIQGEIRKKQLRTWHPRLGGSRGECIYVEGNETMASTT